MLAPIPRAQGGEVFYYLAQHRRFLLALSPACFSALKPGKREGKRRGKRERDRALTWELGHKLIAEYGQKEPALIHILVGEYVSSSR